MDPLAKTTEERLVAIESSVAAMQKQLSEPPTHYHTGLDSNKISWYDIDQKRLLIRHTLPGVQAATDTNYGVFYIVTMPCLVVGFKEVHSTAGTDGSAVTLDLEKLTGTTALDSGVSALATTLSLKATANTVQTATMTLTAANRTLAIGDRLALKDAGTLTAVAGVNILLTLQLI